MSSEDDPNTNRSVTHYHCTEWPEFSCPSIKPLVEMVKKIGPSKPAKPMVIHCSTGIGQTGVLAAMHTALECHVDRRHVDIHRIVAGLRAQREGMVQTQQQYKFCYEATAEALVPFENVQSRSFRPTSVPPPPYSEPGRVREGMGHPPSLMDAAEDKSSILSEPTTPIKRPLVETPVGNESDPVVSVTIEPPPAGEAQVVPSEEGIAAKRRSGVSAVLAGAPASALDGDTESKGGTADAPIATIALPGVIVTAPSMEALNETVLENPSIVSVPLKLDSTPSTPKEKEPVLPTSLPPETHSPSPPPLSPPMSPLPLQDASDSSPSHSPPPPPDSAPPEVPLTSQPPSPSKTVPLVAAAEVKPKKLEEMQQQVDKKDTKAEKQEEVKLKKKEAVNSDIANIEKEAVKPVKEEELIEEDEQKVEKEDEGGFSIGDDQVLDDTSKKEEEEEIGFSIGDDQILTQKPIVKEDKKTAKPSSQSQWKSQSGGRTAPSLNKWKQQQQQWKEKQGGTSMPSAEVKPVQQTWSYKKKTEQKAMAAVSLNQKNETKDANLQRGKPYSPMPQQSVEPKKVGKLNIPAAFGGLAESTSAATPPYSSKPAGNTTPRVVEIAITKSTSSHPTPPSSPSMARRKWGVKDHAKDGDKGSEMSVLQRIKEMQNKSDTLSSYQLPTKKSPGTSPEKLPSPQSRELFDENVKKADDSSNDTPVLRRIKEMQQKSAMSSSLQSIPVYRLPVKTSPGNSPEKSPTSEKPDTSISGNKPKPNSNTGGDTRMDSSSHSAETSTGNVARLLAKYQ